MISESVAAWAAEVNKTVGAGTVVLASDMVMARRFPTGSITLDVALGGGLPGNHWIEIIGPESSGKTATVLKIIATNQALDPDFMAFWLAGEDYDIDQAAALGVDNSRVLVASSQDMELSFDFLLAAVASKEFDLLCLDSYPAMISAEEDEKNMAEYSVSTGARKFNQFWRKAGKASSRDPYGSDRPFIGIIINQFRDKIGGFQPKFGGPVQTSPGGHGKDYAYYARIKVAREAYIEEKQPNVEKPVKIGQTIVWTTLKNKSAAPQKVAKTDFYFADSLTTPFRRGEYDHGKDYVSMGILFGVIRKSGGWLYYGEEKWNGRSALENAVRENVTLRDDIQRDVLAAIKDPVAARISPEDLSDAESAGKTKLQRPNRG